MRTPDPLPDCMLPDGGDPCEAFARLQRLLDLYRAAVVVGVTMEGPRFLGSDASALKRAWEADRQ